MQTAMDVKNGISTTEPDMQLRELIYTSCRVLNVVDKEKGIYKVDTVEPLRGLSDSDTIIAYLYGSAARTTGVFGGALKTTAGGDGHTTKNIELISILDSKHVQLKWDGYSNTGSDMSTDKQLPYLMLSPYKIWVFSTIRNWDITYKGTSVNSYTIDYYPARSYQSALLVDDNNANIGDDLYGVFGPTWNEYYYQDSPTITGINENTWEHDVTDEDGMLDLRDWGFGPIGEAGEEGGYLSTTIPRINMYSKFKMDRIFDDSTLKPGDEVGFTLEGLGTVKSELIFHNSVTSDLTTNVSTKHSERLPYFLTVFEDELPSTPKLSVKPFKDDPFLPEITYTAQDEDLWYGILMIDSEPINSQYHGAILHLPLNEKGNHNSKVGNVSNGLGTSVLGSSSGSYTTVNIDVSDNQIDLSSHGLTAGTPIVIDTLTNATGITEGIRYYINKTSLETNSFRITTNPSGSASGDVAIGGSDDTNIRISAGSPLRNLAYKNNSDTNTSASEFANIFAGMWDAQGGRHSPKHDIEGLGGYAYRFQSVDSDGDGANAN